MTTLFDIGDKITLTVTGVIKEYSCSKDGDCYVVIISDRKYGELYLYLDSEILKASNAQLADNKCLQKKHEINITRMETKNAEN